jgi:hypothetical protein
VNVDPRAKPYYFSGTNSLGYATEFFFSKEKIKENKKESHLRRGNPRKGGFW